MPSILLQVSDDSTGLCWLSFFGNSFQKRRVSSPAPVTIDSESGLMARYRTRMLWPVKVDMRLQLGYFHTMMALSE